MNNETSLRAATALVEELDMPDSAYEAAANRYHDLGKWLSDKARSQSAQYSPSVFPQGSFRLGTAIKPWKREDYDLDLVCNLAAGMTTATWTQEKLKQLVGADLNAYREERGIQDKLEEKRRCWRLNYQDALKFHMDTLPSIPHAENTRRILQERMIKAGTPEALSHDVAELALAITDNKHPQYRQISADWRISNPEGYARWFESRMRQAQKLLESRAYMEKAAKVEDLPVYRWRTPLQRAVQILKRHRDVMFEKNPDGKPISIIITTLAARAYGGEPDIPTALERILSTMGALVSQSRPRVPNPVNPIEDFADRWGTSEGLRLHLEQNFSLWLTQAKADYEIMVASRDQDDLAKQAMLKFGADLNKSTLAVVFGAGPKAAASPTVHQISDPAKPWRG